SSLDRGDLRVDTAPLDIEELVSATVEAMEARVPPSISLAFHPEPAGFVVGDRDRVQQVLVNLIDNAAKYSPDGGEIVVTTQRADSAVRVSVADSGIGISPAEHEQIFEKFYRSDPYQTRGAGGTGLGLYICRELVRRMGGRIGVASEVGIGSTFYFELP